MKISILGSGWLGKAFAKKLNSLGFFTKVSTTNPDKFIRLNKENFRVYLLDITHLDKNISSFLKSDILVIAITSKDIASFEKLIDFIEVSPIKNVLFISSTSVYDNLNGIITEKSPVNKSPLVAIEKLFSSNNFFQTTILRFGGLYGYDRKPGNWFAENKTIKNPKGYVNLIHLDDCLSIMNEIIIQKCWGKTYNACADAHPTREEFYTKAAKILGKQKPIFELNTEIQYKIISSEKLKSEINYNFKHADLILSDY